MMSSPGRARLKGGATLRQSATPGIGQLRAERDLKGKRDLKVGCGTVSHSWNSVLFLANH